METIKALWLQLATWFAADRPAGEVMYWLSQILLAGVALTAAYIAYRQVKAFGALELVKFMQESRNRKARHHVRMVLIDKPFADWTKKDRFHASTVCSSFDLMGFLIKRRLTPKREYIKLYAITVQRAHATLAEYLASERSESRNGPDFWEHFTWLNDEARRIRPWEGDVPPAKSQLAQQVEALQAAAQKAADKAPVGAPTEPQV